MKTNRIIQLAAGVLLLTACTSDFYEEYVNGRVPVSLGYEVLTAEESTRTAASTTLNDATIASGDNITVKIKNNGAATSAYTSYTYTAGASGAMTPPSPKPYYPTGSTNIDILAYYPANAASNFDVSADQTSDANYKASDLMVATVTNQAKTTSTVALAFQHKMAKLVVTATKGDGVNTIQTITLKNVKRRVTFTNTTGEVGTATSISGTDVVLFKDGSAATGTGAALIPAQTIEGDVLEIVTDQGTATYNVPAGKAFAANTKYTISVTVNRTAVGAVNSITWGSSASLTIQPTVEVTKNQYPLGLPGLFSVSATKKVCFSQGNLQYDGTNWKFAEHQYDYIDYFDPVYGLYYITGYPMDFFTWGNTSSSTEWGGGSYYTENANLSGTTDWGSNAISNGGNTANSGWYTLTGGDGGEWEYLFNTRSASTVNGTPDARYAKAKVNNVSGMILFPDTYTHPDGVADPVGVNATDATGWNGNNYSSADWTKMETAGCVFLPAAGARNGAAVAGVDSYGNYWSSTARDTDFAYNVFFNSDRVNGPDSYDYRGGGVSVRLVRPTWYKEVSSATSSDIGKVICSNGHIHTNVSDVACGGSASAIIAYVGSATGESSYNHGLALALFDANGGSTCQWKTEDTTASHSYTTTSSSFSSESGLQYNSTHNSATYPAFQKAIANNGTSAPSGCSAWFLASGYQWNQMKGSSGMGSYTALRDCFSSVGGSNMRSSYYWSCTEYDTSYAWFLDFYGGDCDTNGKTGISYVRSALAF